MVSIPQRLLTNERESYKIQAWNRYHKSFAIKKERRYGLRKNRQPGHRACWRQTKH